MEKQPEKKKDEVIGAADELEELIEQIEKNHPKLKGIVEKLRRNRLSNDPGEPAITLEKMFGPKKAARMRREAAARGKEIPESNA